MIGADTPVSYISPEAYAFLAAAEESAARRADDLDAGVMEIDTKLLQSVLDGWHKPELVTPSSMAPPKRFYRISWNSISRRLLRDR